MLFRGAFSLCYSRVLWCYSLNNLNRYQAHDSQGASLSGGRLRYFGFILH